CASTNVITKEVCSEFALFLLTKPVDVVESLLFERLPSIGDPLLSFSSISSFPRDHGSATSLT
ncbi:hypothetical protein L915_04395, partial [Phytophthora nicotianae]